jgi:putative transposase
VGSSPRIHGELRKLGIAVSERTISRLLRRPRRPPSQTWRTFLTNHVATPVSIDFFTAPTLTGRVLFVFLLVAHHRRRIVHVNITEHPTAAWTAQQMIEGFPDEMAPRWLLRDRDAIYGDAFRRRVAGMGMSEVMSRPSSPWQNPYAERLIGSIRRECLDQVIVLGERHLRRVLAGYLAYYHGVRTGENPSLIREGRAHATARPSADGRSRGSVRGSWWTSPSVRATRSLTRCVTSRMAATLTDREISACARTGTPTTVTSGIEFQTSPALGAGPRYPSRRRDHLWRRTRAPDGPGDRQNAGGARARRRSARVVFLDQPLGFR